MEGWKVRGFYIGFFNCKENKMIEMKLFCCLKSQITNIETKRGTRMNKVVLFFPRDHPVWYKGS